MDRRATAAEPPARAGWDVGELAHVEAWFASLANERRLSRHTASAYRRDLAAFLGWARQAGFSSFAAIDQQRIRAFAAAIHREGLDPRSIQRRLSALRTLFHFLVREGAMTSNPAVDVRAPKGARRLPEAIDVDRMAKLLQVKAAGAAPDDDLEARDRAILELFYSSGLRLSELVGLDLGDLDVADRTVRVLGKGGKTRIVPVGRQAIVAYNAWLGRRAALAKIDEKAAFVGRNGRRLGTRAVQLRVGAWAKRHGIDVKVHPHLFRHSFATHLLESSHDLRGVQELLGHANISTTQVYTHLDFQHLAQVYDSAHPRARLRR